jgi:hypothetical protein
MRRHPGPALLLLACLCLNPVAAFAAENDWNGSWTGYACPKGVATDPARCSSFFLRLHSRNAKVCGSHVFATAGAKQMDEGGTPSVLAQLEGNTASGKVESLRTSPPTSIVVTLHLDNGELRWQRNDNPAGDYLLPRNLVLTRSRQGSMLSAMFEQRLSASCSAHLDMPTDKPAAPANIR